MSPEFKAKIKEQLGNALKALSSKRVYAGVATYVANRQALSLAKEIPTGVTITMMICFTLLGLAYIASETIRNK